MGAARGGQAVRHPALAGADGARLGRGKPSLAIAQSLLSG
jgi:hypothetical protein